VIYM